MISTAEQAAMEALRDELRRQGAAFPLAGSECLLAALKRAHIDMVKLPCGEVSPDAWANQEGGVTLRHHVDLGSNYTAERAREIAGALLAAAATAEAFR